MDSVHDGASHVAQVEEEDRISSFPDDLIHRFFSFLDMKYVVQACILSKRWKHIWKSMPYLNFNIRMYHSLPHFVLFVKRALSRRNNWEKVSTLDLAYYGININPTPFVGKSILEYAFSHDVSQLSMTCYTHQYNEFPHHTFSCQTLKHLTLALNDPPTREPSLVPKSAWDMPALKTLNLKNIEFGDGGKDKSLDLFSKCVKLKDLTLHCCYMSGLKIFNICAPQLSNLIITFVFRFPKVFNVIAPQLRNFTASFDIGIYGPSGPDSSLNFSAESFNSLEKVNLCLSPFFCLNNERYVPVLVDLFQKLSNAKFVTVNVVIIEALSNYMYRLSREPCPFSNPECLKINTRPRKVTCSIVTIPTQVKNYFLENSPNATFIMDLPQVPHKQSRQPIDNTHNKVAKLKEKKEKSGVHARRENKNMTLSY